MKATMGDILLYLKIDKSGKLRGILGLYVDD